MSNYLMLLCSVLLLAGDFALNKLYQKKEGAASRAALRFTAINGLLTAVIFFFINGFLNGFALECTPFSLLMATLLALFGLTYSFIGFRMLRDGNMASYTLFLMTGGMMVPYIWGIFALNEPFSLLRTLGLALIFAGVFCANTPKGRPSTKYLFMGAAVFALNGLVSIVSKMHQIEAVLPAVSSPSFVMLSGVAKFVCCSVALRLIKKESGDASASPFMPVPVFSLIALSALFGGLSYLLQLIGAQNLPATVLYPIITGGAIIFSALAGRLFFRERIARPTLIGIALCFAGTCLFL